MSQAADRPGVRGPWTWGDELNKLDLAVYAAIAVTPTPGMDVALRRLSREASYSRLWLGCSAVLAACGGKRGRRAAENGLTSIALTSAVVNLVLKPIGHRRRPDRQMYDIPVARQVTMPRSTSWPSGHAASAFAFASGVGAAWPQSGIPLGVLASIVAYSRVHTGVHYPVGHDRGDGLRCGTRARSRGRRRAPARAAASPIPAAVHEAAASFAVGR
jgi:hypothetical protein